MGGEACFDEGLETAEDVWTTGTSHMQDWQDVLSEEPKQCMAEDVCKCRADFFLLVLAMESAMLITADAGYFILCYVEYSISLYQTILCDPVCLYIMLPVHWPMIRLVFRCKRSCCFANFQESVRGWRVDVGACTPIGFRVTGPVHWLCGTEADAVSATRNTAFYICGCCQPSFVNTVRRGVLC